jgi:hypothetical protein
MARIDFVLNIKSPAGNAVKKWLSHGILDLDNLFRHPDDYIPVALVEIEED